MASPLLLEAALRDSASLLNNTLATLASMEAQSADLLLQMLPLQQKRQQQGGHPQPHQHPAFGRPLSNTPSQHRFVTQPSGRRHPLAISRSAAYSDDAVNERSENDHVNTQVADTSSFILPQSIFEETTPHPTMARPFRRPVESTKEIPLGAFTLGQDASRSRTEIEREKLAEQDALAKEMKAIREKSLALEKPKRFHRQWVWAEKLVAKVKSGIPHDSPWKDRWDFFVSLTYWYALTVLPVYLSFAEATVRMPNAVPYDQIFTQTGYTPALFMCVRLLRVPFHLFEILRENRIYHLLNGRIASALGLNSAHSRIIMFFGWLVWYLHINACLTYFIGQLSKYTMQSWSQVVWAITAPLWTQYSWAVLMAVGNSWPFTIPMNPTIPSELWMHTIFVFTGALLTGTLTGFIQASRVDMDPPARLYRENLDQANQYLANKAMDEHTRSQVRTYHHLKLRGKVFDHGLVEDLNPYLRMVSSGRSW
ncbi:hypothetical protein HKX48_003329 [Thoreauomyces humboldtii]|nr:hypothetical protein HKX48_003329 [Thoreauomyces humboldtii]